jgi:hypothetical protein
VFELADWILTEHPSKPLIIVHEERERADADPGRRPFYGEAAAQKLRDRLMNRSVLPIPILHLGFLRDVMGESDRIRIQEGIRSAQPGALVILGRSCDEIVIAEWTRQVDPVLPVYVISPAKHLYANRRGLDDIRAVTDSVVEAVSSPRLAAFRAQYKLFRPDVPDEQLYHLSACFGYDAGELTTSAIERLLQKESIADRNIEWLREQLREQLRQTPRSRVGLVSDGGFTERNELYIRPHRQELRSGAWGEVGGRRGRHLGRAMAQKVKTSILHQAQLIKAIERHPIYLALEILATVAAFAALIAGAIKLWNRVR